MKITLITEKVEKDVGTKKLIEIFKAIKAENEDLEINLRIANRPEGMKQIIPDDNECLIVFGAHLYSFLLKDIREFDKLTGTPKRTVDKFSYFIRSKDKHYFLACLPLINNVMLRPDSFLAFESLIKTLRSYTEDFKISLRDVFLKEEKDERKNWPIDLIESGYSPRVKLLFKYEEQKAFLLSLFDKPDWHLMAIDTETSGLKIWDKTKHDVKIASFSDEENVGIAINLGLPGLIGMMTKEQAEEIWELFVKYLFEKCKTFMAWFANYDVFSICNKCDKTYDDFLRTNRIMDGIQILHAFSENRKVTGEGYGIKDASRDLLGYAQYSFIEKYLHYIQNWKTYTVEQILDAANKSMVYACEDAAAEYTLTTRLLAEIQRDKIVSNFIKHIAQKIMEIKLEIEWTGLRVDLEKLVENSGSFAGWELSQFVKPTIQKCQSSTDGRCHNDLFLFSTTTGRVLYGKPVLHQMKILESKMCKYFIADEGKSFIYIDLDSADLRSAALITQDPNLIEDLNASGDYYEKFALKLFDKVGEQERNIAKQFVLSMLNLAGDETIAGEAGISIQRAVEYKAKFYSRYPKMLEYKTKLDAFLRENQYVMSPSFRKRRFSDDDLSDVLFYKSFLSAHNFPFQSTTTDLMALNCHRFLQETKGLGVRQCYWNVDAAVFSIPDEYLNEAKAKLYLFEKTPGIIEDGVIMLQEIMMGNPPKKGLSLKAPKFSFKAYVGKNLKEMGGLQ